MNEKENKLRDLILEKIETGKINMRPRFYFVLQLVALIFVAFLTLVTSSLLVSFIIFSVIASGKLFLFGFGLKGFMMFFVLFPWPLLVIEIALIILLEWLIKKFKFGYSTSLARLVLGILLISLVLSILIDISPLHRSLLFKAEHRDLPLLGDYYRGIRRPMPGQEIFRGTVLEMGTSSFVLNQKSDEDDGIKNEKYFVNFPPGLPKFAVPAVGDNVFVAGKLLPNNRIEAYGLQTFSSSINE